MMSLRTAPILVLLAACVVALPQFGNPIRDDDDYPEYINTVQQESGEVIQGEPFKFVHGVRDDKTGNDYSHNAASDGKVTKGEYRVLLPDGRYQIVKYQADKEHGYQAQIVYEDATSAPVPSSEVE